MMEVDLKTTTKRGKEKLIHRGYGYVVDKVGKDGVVYWKCEEKDALSCKGRMRTRHGLVTAVTGNHTHAPDAMRGDVAKVRDQVSSRAATSQESTHQIVTAAVNSASPATVGCLPSESVLKRTAQRTRVRAGNAPPNPTSLAELVIPQEYTTTANGDDF